MFTRLLPDDRLSELHDSTVCNQSGQSLNVGLVQRLWSPEALCGAQTEILLLIARFDVEQRPKCGDLGKALHGKVICCAEAYHQ